MKKYLYGYRYYLIWGIVLVIYHLIIREYSGDAIDSFSRFASDNSLLECMRIRYESWTSRLLIEAPMLLISKNMTVWLWSIIDIVIMILLMVVLEKLSSINRKCSIFLLTGIMILFPYNILKSAGWVATTMNYTWPMTVLLISMISLKKLYMNEKIGKLEGVFYLLCLLYGTNFETLGVVHVGICIVVFIYMFVDKTITITKVMYLLLQVIISISNMIFALTCPGNWVRRNDEISTQMKDFKALSIIDKITLGFNETLSYNTENSIIFFLFSIMLVMLALYGYNKNKYIIALATVPLIFVQSRTIGYEFIEKFIPTYNDTFDNAERINSTNYQNPNMYIPFIMFILITVIVLVVLLNSIEDIKKAILLCVIFCTTLLTRVAMGLSPTIYASGERTYTFMIIGLIYCIIMIYQEIRDNIRKRTLVFQIMRKVWLVLIGVFLVGNITGIGAGR